MTIILKNKDSLKYEDFIFKCSIGKNGISYNKIEGDKKTPKGTFKLEKIYFRNDRIEKPKTKLKCLKITKKMGWCHDLKHPKKYNRLIKVHRHIKHEKLYRKDNKYDLILVIEYNFKKIKVGKGSAIFLHLTKNYKPTAGCIALKKNDFLILLKLIDKKTKIKIS